MKTHTSRVDDLEWAQPVHQERSQRTLERLFDAAEAEIREKGYADASVVEIARRAGCSVGTLYRRFRDKAALFYALDERWGEAFRATMEDAVSAERWDGALILEVLTGYIEFSLGQGREHTEIHRAAIIMASRDARFAERQQSWRPSCIRGYARCSSLGKLKLAMTILLAPSSSYSNNCAAC